ncbi:MAG TPA: adenylate/guanylate cyclase domain-containing protein [Candidatus Dormibacteraeota bacterium]|nr:adenylate/guanylate cyclase domain-containing protein [Candidatus Dormibacteraeota bacterium]
MSRLRAVLAIGCLPTDSDEERVSKEVFVVITIGAAVAGVVWTLMYLALGRPFSALIPLCISVVAAPILARFATTKRLGFLPVPYLGLGILLPLALQLSLGGYVRGSAVVMWAFMSPLFALIIRPNRETWAWLAAFFGAVVVAALLDTTAMSTVKPLPTVAILVLFALNIAGIGSLTFAALSYFRMQRDAAERRSQQLLLNVLPEPIAARLKRGEEPIADHYDDISVLFADLAGFTVRSAHETPAATVAILNEVFSVFDDVVRRYGLEKIRTIGDSYMVAAGAPIARSDHLRAICGMALELQQAVELLNREKGWDLSFRIGINCGPAVAGIVGRQKFHYDLWGDTVNVASRMESHGLPDRIQVTEAVYERMKSEFVFERRGFIEVKGKGPTLTYLLVGPAPDDAGPNARLVSRPPRVPPIWKLRTSTFMATSRFPGVG